MIQKQRWLERLERKYHRLAIPNLMLILVGAMAIVFLFDRMLTSIVGISLWQTLCFDRSAIASGQIWRVVTFLFLPPSSSFLWIAFSLYLYYLIGTALERQWGSFGFTLYYLLGAVGAIVSGLITGSATNEYLNLSLLFAFAMLNPDFEVRLFFILPVKMIWLAALDAAGFVLLFLFESWSGKLALIMAVINVLIFFTPQLIEQIKSWYRRWKWKQKNR